MTNGRTPGRGAVLPVLAAMLAALTALVVACGRGNSQTSAAGLPKYASASELLAAVTVRQDADRTAGLRLTGRVEGGPGAELGGDGALRVEPDGGISAQFVQTVTPPGRDTQRAPVVVRGGQVFVDAGRGWTRVDEAPTGTWDKDWATVAANLVDGANPAAHLGRYRDAALVAGASDDVVAGIPAVRYLVVVDLVRAAELEQDPAVREALREQVAGGLTRISSLLWIDGQDRPLRSEIRQSVPGFGTVALTAEYRDWGRPVTIAVPEATS